VLYQLLYLSVLYQPAGRCCVCNISSVSITYQCCINHLASSVSAAYRYKLYQLPVLHLSVLYQLLYLSASWQVLCLQYIICISNLRVLYQAPGKRCVCCLLVSTVLATCISYIVMMYGLPIGLYKLPGQCCVCPGQLALNSMLS
jgi:hypothetical protein